MKLSHIAVTQTPKNGTDDNAYLVRAELQNPPSQSWRMQFQLAWHNSPECVSLCSDVHMDDDSIYIILNDSQQALDSVRVLRSLMATMDTQSLFRASTNKRSII